MLGITHSMDYTFSRESSCIVSCSSGLVVFHYLVMLARNAETIPQAQKTEEKVCADLINMVQCCLATASQFCFSLCKSSINVSCWC